jgi:cell shape-determining protein MreC
LENATLYLFSKRELLEEREELLKRLQTHEILLLDRKALAEENAALKALPASRAEGKPRAKAAVLAAPPRSLHDTLILDAGFARGISPGDEVRVGAVVLGTVRTVSQETSVAELFSTPGKTTPVVIVHRGTPIPADAVGEGAGAFRVTLPRAAEVETGDQVILPGDGPRIVGSVEAIRSGATRSFRAIYFKYPVSLWSLWFVDIVKSSAVTE